MSCDRVMARRESRRPAPLHRGLTLIVAAVLVTAVGVAGLAFHFALSSYLNERIDTLLRATPANFDGDPQVLPDERDGDPTTGRGRERPSLQLFATDGTVLRVRPGNDTSGYPFTPALPSPLPEVGWSEIAGGPATFFDASSRDASGPRLRVKVSVDAQGRKLVIALPRTELDSLLNRLALVEVCVSAGVLLGACAAAWWLVRRRLAPLRRLAGAVESLPLDDLGARVHLDATTREVHELTAATNVLLRRMHEAFAQEQATRDRLRQFVADASHELRTPIAAVSAYAQLFELGAKDRPADLARSMAGIRRETTRMRDLTEELLTLAAADGTPRAATRAADVATVIGEAVDAALTVDPRRPVTKSLDPDVGNVAAEPEELRRVLDNVLTNIRTHTPPGTATRITARRQGRTVVMSVSDDGPGLDDEERERMFDRFWRKEASRSRRAGAAGSACRSWPLSSRAGTVTCAVRRLPAAASP